MSRVKFGSSNTYVSRKQRDSHVIMSAFSIVREKDINRMREFVLQYSKPLNFLDDEGNTLMHVLLRSYEDKDIYTVPEIMRYLLTHGVPPNLPNKNGITPLHIAARLGNSEIVNILIDNGSDVNAIDIDKMTPLHYAVNGELSACMKDLRRKALIPATSDGANSKEFNKVIEDAKIVLTGIMNARPFAMYTEHIAATISKNMKFIVHEDLEAIRSNVLETITKIDSGSLGEIGAKVFSSMATTAVRNCTDKCEKVFVKSLDDMKIWPKQDSGWGPDADTTNRILPRSFIMHKTQVLAEMKNKHEQLAKRINDDSILINHFETKINDIVSKFKSAQDRLKDIIMCNYTHAFHLLVDLSFIERIQNGNGSSANIEGSFFETANRIIKFGEGRIQNNFTIPVPPEKLNKNITKPFNAFEYNEIEFYRNLTPHGHIILNDDGTILVKMYYDPTTTTYYSPSDQAPIYYGTGNKYYKGSKRDIAQWDKSRYKSVPREIGVHVDSNGPPNTTMPPIHMPTFPYAGERVMAHELKIVNDQPGFMIDGVFIPVITDQDKYPLMPDDRRFTHMPLPYNMDDRYIQENDDGRSFTIGADPFTLTFNVATINGTEVRFGANGKIDFAMDAPEQDIDDDDDINDEDIDRAYEEFMLEGEIANANPVFYEGDQVGGAIDNAGQLIIPDYGATEDHAKTLFKSDPMFRETNRRDIGQTTFIKTYDIAATTDYPHPIAHLELIRDYLYIAPDAHHTLITGKVMFLSKRLMTNMNALNKNVKELGTVYQAMARNNTPLGYLIPTLLGEIQINILNCVQYVSALLDEKSIINDEWSTIHRVVKDNKRVNNNRKSGYKFYDELMDDILSDGKKELNEAFKEAETTYAYIRDISSAVNDMISAINIVNGIKCIDLYHEKDDFVNADTGKYEDMYKFKIPPIPVLPETLDKFVQSSGDRYEIIKNYLYRVNKQSYTQYVTGNTLKGPLNIYYVTEDEALNLETYRLTPRSKDSRLGFMLMDYKNTAAATSSVSVCRMPINNLYNLQNQTNNLSGDTEKITNDFDLFGLSNDIAYIGIRSPEILKKGAEMYPIIDLGVDNHFNTIKTMIVQNIILIINKALSTTMTGPTYSPGITPIPVDGIYTKIKELHDNYKKVHNLNISLNDHAIFYTFIGKLVDKILVKHIKDAIAKFSREFSVGIFEGKGDVPELDGKEIKLSINTKNEIKMDLNDIIDDIYAAYLRSTIDPPRELYLTPILAHDETTIENYKKSPGLMYNKVYNTNYTHNTPISQESCQKFNTDIIKSLLNNGADPNRIDSSSSSPILYAVEVLNTEVVALMRKYCDTKSPVLNGKSVIEKHSDILMEHLKISTGNDIFAGHMARSTIKALVDNDDYYNNVLRSMDVIFPQLLRMFNESLYWRASIYTGSWLYSDYKHMNDIFKEYDVIVPDLLRNTFADKFDDIIITLYYNDLKPHALHPMYMKIEELNFDLDKLSRKNNEILSREEHIGAANKLDQAERNIIAGDINEFATNTFVTTDNIKKLERITSAQYHTITKDLKDHVGAKLDRKYNTRVVKYYDRIADNIKNVIGPGDTLTYVEMWRGFMIEDNNLSADNFHPAVCHVIGKVLNELKKDKNVAHKLSIFKELYDKNFISYLDTLYTAPAKYNIEENHALYDMVEIIIHVVKHNICSYLSASIRKLLTHYLLTTRSINIDGTDPAHLASGQPKRVKAINVIVDAIMDDIDEFIMKALPGNMTRYLLKIPRDDSDETLSTKSAAHMLSMITDKLITNSIVPMGNDSLAIIALDKYILPYYTDIFIIFIPKMKIMLDNYVRYMHNTYKHIEILIELHSGIN